MSEDQPSAVNKRDLKDAPPVSDLFLSCFERGAQYTMDCSMCGRTHFANKENLPDFDDLKMYRLLALEQPEHFVPHDNVDGVMGVKINGAIFVDGCPCNNARRYEAFILSERKAIIDFLRAYAADQLAEATQAIADLDEGDDSDDGEPT